MEKSGSRWKDSLGIAASALCAVHCAATPILLAFLPTLQFTEWMASPQFHQIAAVICVSLVSVSIWPAFRKFKDFRVLGLSTTGLSMILAAAFLLPDTCCTSSCCSSHASESADGHDHSEHDHAGHDHVLLASSKITQEHDNASHDHAGHDHSKHDHSGHSHSESTNGEKASSVDATNVQLASNAFGFVSLALIQPWLTPIGGVLLICAHFLNMRRSLSKCSTDCKCSSASDAENLLESPAAQAA